ncbi:MAG TPA: ABC transporter permease [Candidatus Scybalocola faecipullorum]|nr:ABC transporter permease [Candidatus Scybalocola faecipullorum]
MKEFSYIIKRILQMIPVLLIITVIIFFGMRLIPGDPAVTMLGDHATPQALEEMRHKLGLDQSVIIQYFLFLKQVITLDFGNSITLNAPVWQLFTQKAAVTLTLTIVTGVFTLIISFVFGYIGGISKNKVVTKTVDTVALIFISVPEFWIGILLMMILGLNLGLFPVGGWGTTWPEHLRSMILPGISGALGTSALMIRNIEEEILKIRRQDYVDFAYSKGLKKNIVRNRYILKNVMVSTITLFSMRIVYMFAGSVVIETVFALPGLGSMLMQGILARDYALVQGLVYIFAVIVLVLNLLTDISYSFINPRIRLE